MHKHPIITEMMATTPTPPQGRQEPCAALLRKIRAHAADGLAACAGDTAVAVAAQLKRAKPQLRSGAAQAMMQGTKTMLAVVEAWGDDLAETLANETTRREIELHRLVESLVEYSTGEVSAFVQATSEAAIIERKQALHDLTQSLTGKATKEQQTLVHALSTKLELAKHKLNVQREEFTRRTRQLEEQNKEGEARLVVSEEKLVAAGRREEAAKSAGQERLKAAGMGRDALEVRIKQLERELKAEKELRVSLQSRSAAAKALWGKASDGVSSGALWTRLANAVAEQEQPHVENVDVQESMWQDENSGALVHSRTIAADTPSKPTVGICRTSEEIISTEATPQPTAASSPYASAVAGAVLESPIFQSPSTPSLGSVGLAPLAKDGKSTEDAGTADADRFPPSASRCSGSQRRDNFGSGIERLSTSRPRSALSLRRQLSLADLDKTKSPVAASKRLQRRASTSATKTGTNFGNGFMADTASSGARAISKEQHKSSQQGRARVALGVRVQGLATDMVAPQFDSGGFPLP